VNRQKLIHNLVLIVAFSFGQISYGQNQANNWFFGHYGGLDFSSGSPVQIVGGQISTHGGSSSISDSLSGQLLCYSDGVNVWNANHQIMPNGNNLSGSTSSTQSALILPSPGHSNEYFLFTVDDASTGQGISYSIIDMTLDSGLGDVSTLNAPLIASTTENVIGIKHCNGDDYWIITHALGNDEFYAYPLTSSGIGAPVVSNVGTVNNNNSGLFMESKGYMKASPNGRRIVHASLNTLNIAEVYDFDKSTGFVSNPITIPIPYSPNPNINFGPFGVSFSPNNNILYVSQVDFVTDKIFQYNLLAGTTSDIVNSVTEINISGFYSVGALQNAPDGKIYVSLVVAPYLGVINDPNILGIGCNFIEQSFNFSLGGGAPCNGFPNFIEDQFNQPTSTINACPADTTQLNAGAGFSYNWSTGETTESIDVTNSGIYSVEILTEGGCILYDTTVIHYTNIDLNLVEENAICEESIELDASNLDASYSWSTGDTTSSIIVNEPGVYVVSVYLDGCESSAQSIISNGCPTSIYVPNAFTPNGDGLNDLFIPITSDISCYELLVFNRWGEIVFNSDDQSLAWAGLYNGIPASEGIYTWKIKYCDVDETDLKIINGHVAILR
jgi:gliding motility-associated-like protein